MIPADPDQLRVGLILPQADGEYQGRAPSWPEILAVARVAEDVGFHSLWVVDHLLYRDPGQPSRGVWECWALIAALGAATSRPEIGSFVCCMGFRNPALLAKIASTTDEISGGRVVLGLGAGWHEPEFVAYGIPFDHRVDRFGEGLQIVHGLLKRGRSDFAGMYYVATDCELLPRGPRVDGPPIMVGSVGPRMIDLTARFADRWNAWATDTGNSPDGVIQHLVRLDNACRAVDRDPASLKRSANVMINLPGAEGPTRDGVPPLSGSPHEIAEGLRRYRSSGIDEVQLWLNPLNEASVDSMRHVLSRL